MARVMTVQDSIVIEGVSPDAVYDQVSAGCSLGSYCPQGPLTRQQGAMLIEKAMRGTVTTPGDPCNKPTNETCNYTYRLEKDAIVPIE